MARFEDLTLDELDVLRIVLSGSEQQLPDDLRAFLLGQVEGQYDAKRTNEKLRSEEESEDADSKSRESNTSSVDRRPA